MLPDLHLPIVIPISLPVFSLTPLLVLHIQEPTTEPIKNLRIVLSPINPAPRRRALTMLNQRRPRLEDPQARNTAQMPGRVRRRLQVVAQQHGLLAQELAFWERTLVPLQQLVEPVVGGEAGRLGVPEAGAEHVGRVGAVADPAVNVGRVAGAAFELVEAVDGREAVALAVLVVAGLDAGFEIYGRRSRLGVGEESGCGRSV